MVRETTSFKEGAIVGVTIFPFKKHLDPRGWLIEIFRIDELGPKLTPVMAYVSETLPGMTRGPHEHVGQVDCFCFLGPSTFRVVLWDNRPGSPTYRNRQIILAGEQNLCRVIVPERVVHAYQNIGDKPGWVINCPNKLYGGERGSERVDEVRYEGNPDNPFCLDD